MRRDLCEVRFDHALGSASPCGEGRSTATVARRLRPGTLLLAADIDGNGTIDRQKTLTLASIGDVVLAGGEAAAMVAIEAVVRLIPGVLGQAASLAEESFEDGLLEHPQYTRPRTFEGLDIPEVLLSGHHAEVRKWRRAQREQATRERRPDLWAAYLANQQAKGE